VYFGQRRVKPGPGYMIISMHASLFWWLQQKPDVGFMEFE
jgi:ribosomal protein L24E